MSILLFIYIQDIVLDIPAATPNKRKFDKIDNETSPSPTTKRAKSYFANSVDQIVSTKVSMMNINEILNRPLGGITELSPNDLVVVFKRGGDSIVPRILKYLDIIAQESGVEGGFILTHKWYFQTIYSTVIIITNARIVGMSRYAKRTPSLDIGSSLTPPTILYKRI